MTERATLWDWDLDSLPEDPPDSEGRNGHEPITEPIPVVDVDADVDDVPQDQGDDASWHELEEPERDFSYARAFVERPPGSPISALTFKPAPRPWYRTKHAMAALIAAAALAVVLVIIPLVSRSPGARPEESTGPAPTGATSAEPSASSAPPAPSAAQPTLTSAPAPPPPPPPAPPPPADDGAPVYTRDYQAPRASEPNKPDVDVTRAPISVAPEARTPPVTAKPGEGSNRRGFW